MVGLQAARTAAIDAPPAVALEGGTAGPLPTAAIERFEKTASRFSHCLAV